MKLVNFEARDIHILLDISLAEINKLVIALDNCEVELGKNEEEKEARQYLQKEFYPYLTELLERFSSEVEGKDN